MSPVDSDTIWQRWTALVNLTPAELEDWLETDESWSVGFKEYGEESVGHASGRRIVGLLQVGREDLSEDDWRHVRKTVGFIRRHLAQRPTGDITDTRWRYSLLNWGHDPLRADR
ncbi:MAG: hypothetical protein JWR35_1470 [Marmoricola sp.]|nr:hypothetical protein [Marmoricola sp.]